MIAHTLETRPVRDASLRYLYDVQVYSDRASWKGPSNRGIVDARIAIVIVNRYRELQTRKSRFGP